MRSLVAQLNALALAALAIADPPAGAEPLLVDGFEAGTSCAWSSSPLAPNCPVQVQVAPPAVTVPAGTEVRYCYHFAMPDATFGIDRIATTMSAGVHHVLLFTAASEIEPPGTMEASCNPGYGLDRFVYAGLEPSDQLVLPDDDGGGTPLAIETAPQQHAYLYMHFLNPGESELSASAALTLDLLAPAAAYTPTEAALFIKYLLNIGLGAQSTSHSCPMPADADFWWLSARTYAHGTGAVIEVLDAGATVDSTPFSTTDSQSPAPAIHSAPPFLEYPADYSLRFTCSYLNETGQAIGFGDSVVADEICIASGYFFPAAAPYVCDDL